MVVGNGSVEALAVFQDHHPGEVTFFTDPDKEAYDALSLVHGFGGVAGLGMLASGVRAWKNGYRQGRTILPPGCFERVQIRSF